MWREPVGRAVGSLHGCALCVWTWPSPTQVPLQAVQVGMPWLPLAFPDLSGSVPTEMPWGHFRSPLPWDCWPGAEADMATAPSLSRRRHSPSRLCGHHCLGCPWLQGLPCAPAESGRVGVGYRGTPHSALPMGTLVLGSGGPSRGPQPRPSSSALLV